MSGIGLRMQLHDDACRFVEGRRRGRALMAVRDHAWIAERVRAYTDEVAAREGRPGETLASVHLAAAAEVRCGVAWWVLPLAEVLVRLLWAWLKRRWARDDSGRFDRTGFAVLLLAAWLAGASAVAAPAAKPARTYTLHAPLIVTADNAVVRPGRYVQAADFAPADAPIVQLIGNVDTGRKLWGPTCQGVEIVGHPQHKSVGLYVNGAARVDLDVRILDCNGGGAMLHGWNVRAKIHAMNCGLANPDAIAVRVHNQWADAVADPADDDLAAVRQWYREASNIVRLLPGTHLERSPRLLVVDAGANDIQFEGILHGPTAADRVEHSIAWQPLVEFAGASGACRLAGQLVWSEPDQYDAAGKLVRRAAPSVVLRDLGAGPLPRPLNLRVELTCSEWRPAQRLVETELRHPLSHASGSVQKYRAAGVDATEVIE